MAYTIGVSSGIFGAAPPEEKFQYATLSKKAQYILTKGVKFVQIDLESVAEFREPNLDKNLKEVTRLGVTFGMHSETRAFGVETAELDSAIETDYKFGHERLAEILEKAGDMGSKYLLIHSSESQPFRLLERNMQPAALVDYFGNDFRAFLERDHPELIEWLMGGTIVELTKKIHGVWMEKKPRITERDIEKVMKSKDFIWIEVIGHSLAEVVRRTIESIITDHETRVGGIKYEDFERELPDGADRLRLIDGQIETQIESTLRNYRNYFLDHIRSRRLAYGPERFAYWFVARYMETNKDKEPLWDSIVNATLEYNAKADGKTVDEWKREKGIEKLSIDDPSFREYSYIWVPAVSAKYIWGHLNQDQNPENKDSRKYIDLKKILKKWDMPLVLETPMAHRGIEEWLRLPNPVQMYYLAKEVGKDYVQLAMDFEHMLSIKLDVNKVIECMPKDGGDYVTVVHLGYPSPMAPAHFPIPAGSNEQLVIYTWLYNLRQKGFKEAYWIFERGGGKDPIQRSVAIMRWTKKLLEKNTSPKKLPDEYFFLPRSKTLAVQKTRMFEHAFDPLKGVLKMPEEEHTLLSTAAIRAGKRPEEWKKEEFR